MTRFGPKSNRALGPKGFSLLEILVAIVILAVSFTTLALVQTRATRLAMQAQYITKATSLARLKLYECKNEVQKQISSVGDYKEEGDFSEIGFPDFKWECHAPRFNMKPPAASKVESQVKEVAPEKTKKDLSAAGSISAPIISMVTDSLGDSVRELCVIVRWNFEGYDDEMRVVTHVVDLNAMSALSRMLAQGLSNFDNAGDKNKNKEKKENDGGPAPPGMEQRPPFGGGPGGVGPSGGGPGSGFGSGRGGP